MPTLIVAALCITVVCLIAWLFFRVADTFNTEEGWISYPATPQEKDWYWTRTQMGRISAQEKRYWDGEQWKFKPEATDICYFQESDFMPMMKGATE